ncbi:putative G-patch DNA repair protein (Drt111) [Aspergillus clavatus NRRL 1]|uniref:G-patch DNA repair protein (Drt111), putative n=1 Tax=Aspergillus clavatus (strain ATCC 1007 / CBS 513.65 / DSM 816 / NCTC 3887 / NRRL 1 / QM 1276 / 107) TaxID=344612 RepID=A1CGZ2_ASPCL|nr:G-patch DNA repair protein (Drt111), putative [Aspergillus clavatus NRRL 1]EAW10147.1 G-patch DNA repair protein (Drt111), putative [Aspergillus clavatus NRRL 1]
MTSDLTPPNGGGLSLYANLLNPSANTSTPGTISRAPVVFKQASEGDAQTDETAAKKQQLGAASLRFQPTKRPQLAAQKPKPKPALPKATPASATAPVAAPKTTLADWAATEEDDINGFYAGEKRQRGGRKKRKKNREAQAMVQNWDDIYDPSRPNIYEEYKHSDEQIAEIREWKDRLYAHRMVRSPSRDSYSDEDTRPMNRQFAPPRSFAPPPNLNNMPPAPPAEATEDTFDQSPPPPPPGEPPVPVPDDPTGEDAYLKRLQMSAGNQATPQPAPPPLPRPLDTLQPASATISRAPVRYTLPPPPEDIPATEAELEEVFAKEQPAGDEPEGDDQRSLRPGQKGFAERLLAKYGWTKGSGLGATGSGIVKPLQVKVEKQKKRPDSEGGGFVTPAGRGKIIGGTRKTEEEEGKFGRMSEVIVLKGMLDGMDLDAELEGDQDGGLMQEIGEECSEKYGRVERVFISRDSGHPVPVFVKFTNQLSALRAVNALEGRVFNGNTITVRFYDTQKFEQGVYDD